MGVCENPNPNIRNITIFKNFIFHFNSIKFFYNSNNRLLRHLVLVFLFFFQENFSQTKCTLQAKNKVRKSCKNNPPITTVAKGLCTSAPSPLLRNCHWQKS